MPSIIAIVIIILVWGAAIYLAVITPLIKDPVKCPKDNPPYSFAGTQLLWWTLIIISCYVMALDATDWNKLPKLNDTVLTLLGISLGTTVGGRIAGNPRDSNRLAVNIPCSDGFFRDILSDENGISVHRFQAVVFNILFGVSFYTQFINGDYTFETFDPGEFALLGISSAGYVALKMNEKLPKHSKVPQPPADATANNTEVPPATPS